MIEADVGKSPLDCPAEAFMIQAHALLVNSIMTPPADEDPSKWPKLCVKCIQHIKKDLGVSVERLDRGLYSRISGKPTSGETNTSAPPQDQTCTDAASQASEPQSCGPAPAPAKQPPAKKLKGFRQVIVV